MAKKVKKRVTLTRKILFALGIPGVFIPGLILASILGWDWQKGLSELAQKDGYYQSERLFPKKAYVTEIEDGDTLILKNGRVIRLLGIDAPNRGQPYYQEAMIFSQRFALRENILLEYDTYQDDKYGRILAYVFVPCTTQKGCRQGKLMLNKALVSQGLAKVVLYQKRKKLKYQEDLLQAQDQSRQNHLNLWK